MKTWVINPFRYIAGTQSLFIGLTFMAITLFIAHSNGTHFDGAIDAHIGAKSTFLLALLEQLIAWGIPVIVFFSIAIFISDSKFRFIDIAGTMALARGPMLIVALMGYLPALHTAKPGNITTAVLIISLVMLIPLIWMITLMYNAFSISFNLKTTKAISGFIGGLLLAEIICVILSRSVLTRI